MIDKLSASLDFYQQALGLRHQRQQVLAANIANADTPHYKARDFDFAAELSRASDGSGDLRLATTDKGHIAAGGSAGSASNLLYRVPDQPSLDGNTVDMNRERTHFADNSVRYQSALTLANARIQGLKSAMQSES
ncbi:flagellar basal body rod protein FlgB [Parahaliea aestuarii]|uniref:Flagellar basal body rod protein FlgB n=1 Tax=Parahaliea aestuarii TaxID=1852021 RepID=A0A5C9A4W7_9GAMM|nr:flagellar basal body rod protein FlgB [Parahaliea aestuarii]TXS94770.1 flagellar basal body rod protein FlgB [Parahaliea aestuarii]